MYNRQQRLAPFHSMPKPQKSKWGDDTRIMDRSKLLDAASSPHPLSPRSSSLLLHCSPPPPLSSPPSHSIPPPLSPAALLSSTARLFRHSPLLLHSPFLLLSPLQLFSPPLQLSSSATLLSSSALHSSSSLFHFSFSGHQDWVTQWQSATQTL